MRQVVGFVVVVAVLCGGAWLWLATDEPAPAVDAAAARAPRGDDAPSQPAAHTAADTEAGAAAPAVREIARDSLTADAPAAASGSEPPHSSWSIEVVDARSQAPIAGARVWLVPFERMLDERWPGLGMLVNEPLTILEREAPIGVSRADGTIDATLPSASFVVAASVPGRFGAVTVDARANQRTTAKGIQRLWMHDDAELRVEVVDASGTPRSFVPVDLVVNTAGSSGRGRLVHRALPVAGATVVSIPHARWRMAGALSFAGAGSTAAVRPAIAPLENSIDETRVNERHCAGETLRIVAPPCAPIRVRLLQADGTPWPYEGFVHAIGAAMHGRRTLPLRAGEALFDAVDVNPAFDATVRALDPRFAAVTVEQPGPRVPWVETVLIAQLPPPDEARPVLAGRVLNVDGSPAAGTEFLVMFTRPSGTFGEPRRFTTASDGRFEFAYGDDRPPARRALFRSDWTRGPMGFDPSEWAPFALPDPLPLGKHELGDVRLEPAPTLVAGRARTSDGAPAAGAEIKASIGDDANLEPAVRGEGGTLARGQPRVVDATSDPDGTFRIHGPESGVNVRLTAQWRRSTLAPLDVASGRDDVVLEFPQLAWIRGRILWDAHVRADWLYVKTRVDDAAPIPGAKRRPGVCIPKEDGTFEMEYDAGQTPRVRVALLSEPSTLLELDAVQASTVPPGGEFIASDPRLAALDIRGMIRLARGLVLDADEKPIAGAWIRHVATSGNEPRTDAAGRFVLLTSYRAPLMRASAPGFRPVEFTADVDDLVVHLRERATPLTVRLPDKLDLARFAITRVWVEDPSLPEKKRLVHEAEVADGVANLFIDKPGAYVVRFVPAFVHFQRNPMPDLAVPIEAKDATPIDITLPVTQAQLDAIQPPAAK